MSKLYQYFKGNLQRVDKRLESLSSKCAYLLVTETAVCLFIGANVGRVDMAKAENLADSLKAEVRGATKVQKIQQSDPNSYLVTDKAYFWRELQVPAANARSINAAISNDEPTAVRARIWKMVKGSDDAAQMELCAESVIDAAGKTRPLSIPELSPDSVYLLLADSLEAMLWIGNRVEKEDRDQCESVVQAHLASIGASGVELIQIKAHMEPVVFKFHLCAAALDSLVSKTSLTTRRASAAEYKQSIAVRKTARDVEQDMAARHRLASKVASEAEDKRPIGAEVERMTNELMGTLGMLTQGIGDNTRALKLSLLEDESAQLRVWAIKGTSRKLEPVAEEAYGIFDASVVYAVLYECKAGAKAVLYMWIGEHCPGARKAALALQVNDLIQREQIAGAIEQITVDQGKESQFFLSLFALRGRPVVTVEAPLTDAPSAGSHRIFETYFFHTTLRHESIVGRELSTEDLAAQGLFADRSYIFVQYTGGQATGVTLLEGGSMPSRFLQQTHDLANQIAQLAGQTVEVVSWDGRDAIPALADIVAGSRIQAHEVGALSSAARPRRMWCVSNTRRRVGAMFVEEIGQGGTFTQTDLNANDCFVLDDGSQTLFVWHGPQADLDSRALGTKVARMYCKRYKAQKNVDLNIVHLESQSESVHFKAMFLKWNASLQQVPNKAFVDEFNPDNVQDERDAPTVRSAATKLWEPAAAGARASVTAALLRDAGIGGGARPRPASQRYPPTAPQTSPSAPRRTIRRNDVDAETAVMSKPTISATRRAPTSRRPAFTAAAASAGAQTTPLPPQSPVRSPQVTAKSSPAIRRAMSSESSSGVPEAPLDSSPQTGGVRAIPASPIRRTPSTRLTQPADAASPNGKPPLKRIPSNKQIGNGQGARPRLRRTLSEVPPSRDIHGSATPPGKSLPIARAAAQSQSPAATTGTLLGPTPTTTTQRTSVRRQLMRSHSTGGDLGSPISGLLSQSPAKTPASPIATRTSVRKASPSTK